MSWWVGKGPEVVESGVGWKISRLVVEISKKNSENLNTFANFHVIEPRKETYIMIAGKKLLNDVIEVLEGDRVD